MEAAHFSKTSEKKALYRKRFNNPVNDNMEIVSVNLAARVLTPKCL
jgi:hypothetical protein